MNLAPRKRALPGFNLRSLLFESNRAEFAGRFACESNSNRTDKCKANKRSNTRPSRSLNSSLNKCCCRDHFFLSCAYTNHPNKRHERDLLSRVHCASKVGVEKLTPSRTASPNFVACLRCRRRRSSIIVRSTLGKRNFARCV